MPTSASKQSLSFLNLPKQLRLMIYEQVKVTYRHHNMRFDRLRRTYSLTLVLPTLPVSLLATHSVVHHEALSCWKKELDHDDRLAPSVILEVDHRTLQSNRFAVVETLLDIIPSLLKMTGPTENDTWTLFGMQMDKPEFDLLTKISTKDEEAIIAFMWGAARIGQLFYGGHFQLQVGVPIKTITNFKICGPDGVIRNLGLHKLKYILWFDDLSVEDKVEFEAFADFSERRWSQFQEYLRTQDPSKPAMPQNWVAEDDKKARLRWDEGDH